MESNTEKLISATFNSVELIKSLEDRRGKLIQEELETLERNKEHIRIMLSKDEFISLLTLEQREELVVCINN